MNWQLSARISSKAFIMKSQFEKVDVKTLSIILCLNFWLQEPLVVQWLRLCASTAGGTGLISGQGTIGMYASQTKRKKKKIWLQMNEQRHWEVQ